MMMPWHPAATTLFHPPWPPQPPQQQQWHTLFPTQSLFPLSHQSPMPMMHYASYQAPAVMSWNHHTSPWASPPMHASSPPMRPPAAQPPPRARSPVDVTSIRRPSPKPMPADPRYTTTVASSNTGRPSPFSVVHINNVSDLDSFAEFANQGNIPRFGTPEPINNNMPPPPAVPAVSTSLLDGAPKTWETEINYHRRRLTNPIVHNGGLAYQDAASGKYYPVDDSDPFELFPASPRATPPPLL